MHNAHHTNNSFLVYSQLDQSAHVLQTLAQFWTTEEASRPEMFSDLVHSMRHLTHAQLLSIFYNGITDDQTRKVVLDALPLLKTDAAITLMSDIIESGSLPLGLVDTWFATLPFYKNPTRGMLSVVLVRIKVKIARILLQNHEF